MSKAKRKKSPTRGAIGAIPPAARHVLDGAVERAAEEQLDAAILVHSKRSGIATPDDLRAIVGIALRRALKSVRSSKRFRLVVQRIGVREADRYCKGQAPALEPFLLDVMVEVVAEFPNADDPLVEAAKAAVVERHAKSETTKGALFARFTELLTVQR